MTESPFVNRELSWLEFNRRVFEEAQDPTVPLLERVKFLAIFSSNLDEFFMVRVAGLKRRVRAGDDAPGPDGLSAGATLAAISERVHELVREQHRCFLEELQPLLAAEGISLVRPKEATPEQQRFLEEYFQSFDAVTRFVRDAAVDPRVLAIKMTLYRVSPSSPIAQALTLAAENGKEVAVLVELRARFDEEANIRWARALEEVGAHVVYGLVGYKTHCKACLVVRQEPDGIRRYCHLATGNYNVRTGGIYGDFGLFTCRESFGEDLTELFNLLTGYTRPRGFRHLLVAPTGLRDGLVERIHREVAHARAARPARIIAKMNSLVDRVLSEELYAASQAGVRIDLIVRGICCLRPGVPGLSDRIRAVSIVDRFLEHARVFCFDNDGEPEYLLASADWMPRNLDHRVEVAFPVLAPDLQRQIRAVLDAQLADTVKGRLIRPDGRSERLIPPPTGGLRSQERLYTLAAASGLALEHS